MRGVDFSLCYVFPPHAKPRKQDWKHFACAGSQRGELTTPLVGEQGLAMGSVGN